MTEEAVVKKHMDSWLEFSLHPQTEEDIRNRILTHGIDSICTSYVCKFSKMSEEFVEEFRALSTGLILGKEYYEENLQAVQAALDIRNNSELNNRGIRYKLNKLGSITIKTLKKGIYIEIPVQIGDIKDRLDWVYLSQYQRFSEEFIIRHENEVDWTNIFKYQDISQETKQKYSDRVSVFCANSATVEFT